MKAMTTIVAVLCIGMLAASGFDAEVYSEHLAEFRQMDYPTLVAEGQVRQGVGLVGSSWEPELSAAYFRRLLELESDLVDNLDIKLARKGNGLIRRLWTKYPDDFHVMKLRLAYATRPFGVYAYARYALLFYGMQRWSLYAEVDPEKEGGVSDIDGLWTSLIYGMADSFLFKLAAERLNDILDSHLKCNTRSVDPKGGRWYGQPGMKRKGPYAVPAAHHRGAL